MEQTGHPLRPAATQVALRSRWETFQDGETIDSGVRPEIAASWRRSAASRLGSALMAAPLDQAALRGFESIPTHPSARQQFMAASTRLADNLVAELEDAVAAVVVCDDFGVVLYRAGRPEVLRQTDNVNLIPGGVWSEPMAGTNGIGLALELGGARVAPARGAGRARRGGAHGQPAPDRARGHQRRARAFRRQRQPRGQGARDRPRDAAPAAAGLPHADVTSAPRHQITGTSRT